jgi:hypothetical protein
MTREKIIDTLERLRDDMTGSDTDVAAIAAVMVRMLKAGDDLTALTEAALDVEVSATRARETGRLNRPN